MKKKPIPSHTDGCALDQRSSANSNLLSNLIADGRDFVGDVDEELLQVFRVPREAENRWRVTKWCIYIKMKEEKQSDVMGQNQAIDKFPIPTHIQSQ